MEQSPPRSATAIRARNSSSSENSAAPPCEGATQDPAAYRYTRWSLAGKKVADLRKLCKAFMRRKNKLSYNYSRAVKKTLIQYILKLQMFEDDDQGSRTEITSLSPEQQRMEQEAKRAAQEQGVARKFGLAQKPKTVQNKVTQYRKFVKYLLKEQKDILFNAGPPPAAGDARSAHRDEAFGSGWQIDFKKLTPAIFCTYLDNLEVERMSPQQKLMYDSAPIGKKPRFTKAHGGLEAINTAIKWAANLVGMKFPPEWERTMKTYLDGVKNDQAQEVKHGRRFKNGKRHLPADLFEAIIAAMCDGIHESGTIAHGFGCTSSTPAPGGAGIGVDVTTENDGSDAAETGDDANDSGDDGSDCSSGCSASNSSAAGSEGNDESDTSADDMSDEPSDDNNPLVPEFTPELAARIRQRATSVDLWVWPFLLLLWNLITRGEIVASLVFESLSVEIDGLSIDPNASKTNQSGAKDEKRNIFANPFDWKRCVFVALGVHLSTWTFNPNPAKRKRKAGEEEKIPKGNHLFPGTSTMATFQKLHRKIIASAEVQRLMDKYGLTPEDIGLHSPRKGAATFLSSASTICHYVSLMLRAGWSMNIQDAYLKTAEGGDCLIGRQLAGLPQNSPEFATMPPRFKSDVDENLVTKCINETFATVLQHNPTCRKLRPVLRVLLASMMNARDKIRYEHRTVREKYTAIPIFSPEYDELAAAVWVPTWKDRHKLPRGEHPRGIPHHIESEMRNFDHQERNAAVQISYLKTLLESFDRYVDTQKRIDDRVSALELNSPNVDAAILRELASVREDIRALGTSVNDIKGTLAQMRESLQNISQRAPSEATPPLSANTEATPNANHGQPQQQQGGEQPVEFDSATYSIPASLAPEEALTLYFMGCKNPMKLAPPLRHVALKQRTSQIRLAKIRKVGRFVENAYGAPIKTREHLAAAVVKANQLLYEETGKEHQYFENLLGVNLSPMNYTTGHMKIRTFYNKIAALERFKQTHKPGSSTAWIRRLSTTPRPPPTVLVLPSMGPHSMTSGAIPKAAAAVTSPSIVDNQSRRRQLQAVPVLRRAQLYRRNEPVPHIGAPSTPQHQILSVSAERDCDQ